MEQSPDHRSRILPSRLSPNQGDKKQAVSYGGDSVQCWFGGLGKLQCQPLQSSNGIPLVGDIDRENMELLLNDTPAVHSSELPQSELLWAFAINGILAMKILRSFAQNAQKIKRSI